MVRKFDYCGDKAVAFKDEKNNVFYFSYDTLVGFLTGGETFCIINYWSVTTGKHLNVIQPDHSQRLDRDQFNKKYEECFNK